MGSQYKTFGPELPQMPGELARARQWFEQYTRQGLGNQQGFPGGFQYSPTTGTQTAQSTLNQLLGGGTYGTMQTPGLLGDVQNMLSGALQSGFRTDTDPAHQAMRASMQDTMQKNIGQTMHEQVLGGRRAGSGSAHLVGQQVGQAERGFASDMSMLDAQLQEAASGRRMQAGQLGAGVSQQLMDEMARLTGMQAGLGQQEFENRQGLQDRQYQDWLRQQPGYSPLYQGMGQYAMSYPFHAQSPTVAANPLMSLISDLFGAGGQVGAAAVGAPGKSAGG